MIDIHSHLLYGIDDGPMEIGESIELLKQAISVGYTGIVCSSHYYIGRFENRDYDKNFDILEKKIVEENLNIRIYKGNEFALFPNYSEHEERINRINNGRYILIELKNELIYPICKEFFQSLLSQGVIPVLAHIERYPHIKVKELIELYNMGVILQVNLRMAANPIERIKYLLENRYVGVVATDTHRLGKRDYNVGENLEKLKRNLGEEYFNIVTDINPRKIVNNEIIERVRGEENELKKNNGTRGFFSSLWSKLCRG